MSTPGGTPNPYLQPPGQPLPGPHHPYAPSLAPPAYGFPQQQAGPVPGFAGYGPPGTAHPAPPRGGGRRGGLPGLVWGVVGVVVASAAWGGTLLATGGFPAGETADHAGHAFRADLCEAADLTAFESEFEPDPDTSEPASRSLRHPMIDTASCDLFLRPIDDYDYNSLYLTYEAIWHKDSDPEGEFAGVYSSMEEFEAGDQAYDYEVETLGGLGDEAYIVYRRDTGDGQLTWVTLGVRAGWFEMTTTWNAFLGTDGTHDHLQEEDYVTRTLRESVEATLAALRGESGGSGDGANA